MRERRDGAFRDPDIHAWVDLLTNFASLPNVRLEHVRFLEQGRVPVDIVNTVMHEMMHHWCFFTPVGEVLALLKYRVRHALLAAPLNKELARWGEDLDVACDIVRYEVTEKVLGPIIEGLALFTEHDAVTGGSDESYCRPLQQMSLFIMHETMMHELGTDAAKRIHFVAEVDEWLQRNRTRAEGVERKANLLASPLHPGKSIYLPGYLALKAFVAGRNSFFSGSYDKILGYLRDYFFRDYGLVDAMFGSRPEDDDPIDICDRVSTYMLNRVRDLFQRDLTADLLEWNPPDEFDEGATKIPRENIKLADNLIYQLSKSLTRGINIPDDVAALGYRRHRDLFRVFDTSGENPLLEGHKLRGLREFVSRRLMRICSERIGAVTIDGMVEARDSDGQTVARMQKIASFDDTREALIDFFFIPTESAIVGAIFVEGKAVAISAREDTKADFLGLVKLLEPTTKQLEALKNAQALDRDLVRENLAVYHGLLQHVEKQYAEVQDGIYRPAVSMLICAPDFDWHETLSQLDDIGLVSVLDTKMELLDIARLSLFASRPRKQAELSVDFAQSGRDLGATLEQIRRVRDHHGLDLIDTTTDDRIFSLI
jgi:hypothetical protein